MQSNDVNAAAVNGKEAAYFGVPWEGAYGYAQAIKVGDTIRVSGQLSHDEKGNLIAPASLDESGKPAEFSMMEQQMRATYANAVKLLARLGATLDNVVEETLYVLDVDAAFAAAGKVRKACVTFPVLSARSARYEVHVVGDACGGLTSVSHDLAMRRMEAAGAKPTSWIQVLLELQRDWTRHETYDGARAIVEAHGGGYGIGLAYARDMIKPA
jgi:enamine deaminase RidA (YjgF/YER057c/UK114 family)